MQKQGKQCTLYMPCTRGLLTVCLQTLWTVWNPQGGTFCWQQIMDMYKEIKKQHPGKKVLLVSTERGRTLPTYSIMSFSASAPL